MNRYRLYGMILLPFLCVSCSGDQDADPARYVQFPHHSNQHFGSLVINTQAQFDDLVKSVDTRATWEDSYRKAFREDFKKGIVNFKKEALVLINLSRGSSSFRVDCKPFELKGDTLVFTVTREVPKDGFAPDDVDDYYALAVRKDRVKQVEVRVITGGPGKETPSDRIQQVLTINGKPGKGLPLKGTHWKPDGE